MKTVIHLHTTWSHDSNIEPRDLVDRAVAEGIDCVAITDHNEIDGAIDAAKYAREHDRPVRVIIGEEVCTNEGHILGLFLRERIVPHRPAADVIDEIHAQGGLAFAAHPFVTLCDSSVGRAIYDLADRIDAIEILNAQNPLWWQDRRAERFARAHEIPMFVGCDTHIRGRLAPAWQEMAEFDGPTQFLAALRRAEFHRGRFGPVYIAQMLARHVWDMVMPRPLPGYATHLPDRADERAGGSVRAASATPRE